MSIPTHNFTWQQGEDGEISLVYKQNGSPVDLTGYSLRMDVRNPTSPGTVLFTFNTEGADAGGETDSGTEGTLGADGSIYIVIPRSASLGEGALASSVGQVLNYDIFLRDTNDKQKKILRGTIVFEESHTKWI